jgi:hypothetical protein
MSPTTFPVGILASSILKNNGSFESIATVSVGSGGQSSIVFSSIPQTYKHLQIRGIGALTGSTADYYNQPFYFNTDNTANYARHGIRSFGSGTPIAIGAISSTRGYLYDCMPTSASGSVFGTIIIDIIDYANTSKLKTIRGISGNDANGLGAIGISSTLWNSTSAIDSITFEADAGKSYLQYTQFSLYGIKG